MNFELLLFCLIFVVSDRVYAAVVRGFNEATDSVTVEWFENQETKGKELDLNHLASLNPASFPALNPGKEICLYLL
jgi:hypothetical protein